MSLAILQLIAQNIHLLGFMNPAPFGLQDFSLPLVPQPFVNSLREIFPVLNTVL
jgi:hypothetical protein